MNAPKEMEVVWVQNLKGFINGAFPMTETWKKIFIERLDSLQDWRPIDSAPKDDWIMGWCGWHIVVRWAEKGIRVKGGWTDDVDGVNPVFMLTHWMPLPAPPSDVAKDE